MLCMYGRFLADMSGAEAEVLQDKSGQFSFIVSVNHADNRHWLLVRPHSFIHTYIHMGDAYLLFSDIYMNQFYA